MSRWKALAAVADVSPHDLANRLTNALEILHLVADALECEPTEAGLLDAVTDLQRDAKDAHDEVVDAETERDEARDALEKKLQEEADTEEGALKQERDDAIIARDTALARLAAVEPLIEGYSDALAHARRFVSVAEQAGLKTKHVRKAGQ